MSVPTAGKVAPEEGRVVTLKVDISGCLTAVVCQTGFPRAGWISPHLLSFAFHPRDRKGALGGSSLCSCDFHLQEHRFFFFFVTSAV